jgi:large subunit ribosomal protein L53
MAHNPVPRTQRIPGRSLTLDFLLIEDGKELKLESEKLGIKGIIEEVDRHSRVLQKKADLTDG